jgi:hypothetical protein
MTLPLLRKFVETQVIELLIFPIMVQYLSDFVGSGPDQSVVDSGQNNLKGK